MMQKMKQKPKEVTKEAKKIFKNKKIKKPLKFNFGK